MRIEVLELVGAVYILHDNYMVQEYGWRCWYEAAQLRKTNGFPKILLPQSDLEKLSLGTNGEFKTVEDWETLFKQSRKNWTTQAMFISIRILTKNECFPNEFDNS